MFEKYYECHKHGTCIGTFCSECVVTQPKLEGRPTPQYKHLSEQFLKAMDEIGQLGLEKHGVNSFQAMTERGRIERTIDRHQTKAIMEHARKHTFEYEINIPHDHFGDLLHQLAAVAYNVMVEAQLSELVRDK